MLDPTDPETVERYLAKATQAQAYVETMKVNTQRGKRKRMLKDGKLPTGRGVFYGYDYDKQTGQNKANACLDTVRMMGLWVLEERISTNEVCRRLMDRVILAPKGGLKWSRSAVGRILRNPAYAGKSYANKTRIVDGKRISCPQGEWIEMSNATDWVAFTWEEWQGIQRQLDRNQELSPRNQKLSYLLKSMVHCSQCGRKYHGIPVHGKPYYRCSGRNKLVSIKPCHNKTINAGWLEDMVWSEVEQVLRNPELILSELRQQVETGTNTVHLEEQIKQLDRQLETLEEASMRYLRLYGAGLYSFEKLESECDRLKSECDKISLDKANLERRFQEAHEQEFDEMKMDQMLRLVASGLESLGPEEKRLALDALNIKVWIDGDSVAIDGFIPVTDAAIVSPHS